MIGAITLTKRGPEITANHRVIEDLRTQFSTRSFVYLRQLIAPDLLELLSTNIESSSFQRLEHKRVGAELGTPDLKTGAVIGVLFNNAKLFEFVRTITDCGSIGSFIGRVYRYLPDEDHYDAWHDDMIAHRLVALSINIGKQAYEGGFLELRDKNGTAAIETIPNTGFGDAILFRLAAHLEHRRTAVRGHVAKTAIAGWFCSEPKFMDLIHRSQID
jgi:hypothetical protein